MSEISPSIPFHLGRADRAGTLRAGQRTIIPSAEPREMRTAPVGRSAALAAALAAIAPPAPRTPAIASLVAARVPGGIDFSTDTPVPTGAPALPFYRHPADKNAAATALTAGAVIDATA